MTAADAIPASNHEAVELPWSAEAVAARVGLTCRTATSGRRAVRVLAEWARRFKLNECEFQVLWSLGSPALAAVDQTTLVRRLAYSPAQVSATMERLRGAGWIVAAQMAGDRRRNVWQLSESGRRLLDEMLAAAGLLQFEVIGSVEPPLTNRNAQEAA